jgi:predicted nuclease with RNAse H fold
VITVGIDLAAEAKNTACATVEWSAGSIRVRRVEVAQDNAQLIAAVDGAVKVGIDSPLGWPLPFIDFLAAQRDRAALPPTDLAGRRGLAYRETDRAVTALTGLRPLSVAADRIALPAMRAVGLLAVLGDSYDVDRAGRGLVVEAYPAAALRQWKLPHSRYKGPDRAPVRAETVQRIESDLPSLRFDGGCRDLCVSSDHAFDAVVCALIARAAHLGRTIRPGEQQLESAAIEGWIAVPDCTLAELASP